MAKENKQKFESVSWLKHYRYWIVFAFSFLLYANTIPNFYALDDELVTTTEEASPHRLTSKGITAIPQIFTEPYYKDNQGYAYDYRPLVLTTFAIEHSLFGDNPHVSHFFNVLLYALLCVLLLKVLEALLRNYNPLLAFIATLFFAAHPVHTEVVASIKNRDEILALLFALIACWGLFRSVEFMGIKKILYSILGFTFLLAILSKPTAIVLLPILILFVVIRNKESLLILLVLSLVTILLFATTQSSIFSVFQFLIMVGVVWAAIFILYIITYSDTIINSKWAAKLRGVLKGYQRKIGKFNIQSFGATSISIKTAVLSGLFLFLLATVLVLLNIPKGFVPIFFLAPLTYFLQRHKHFELIHFVVFIFLLSVTVLLDMYTSGLLFYVGYIATRKEIKVDKWYAVFTAYSAFVIFLFTESQIGFILISIVTLIAILHQNKLVKYFVVLCACVLPTVSFFVLREESNLLEAFVSLFIANSMGVIIVLLALRVEKKWQWGLICILIFLISFSGYVPDGYIKDFNTPVEVSHIYQKKLPQVIEQHVYDRPITYIEAVTNALSPMEYKLGTAAQVLKKYASLLVVPYPLSFYYGYKIIDHQSGFEPLNILVLAVYFLFGITGLLFLRKQKIIAISILVMAIGISIYTNVFLAAPGMMADRFLFVPSLGFCLLLAYAILKLYKQNIENNSVALNWQTIAPKLKYSALAILLVYSGLTIARNADWKNSLTLFSADIGHLENSAQANNMYASELMKQSFLYEPNQAQQMRLTAELHFKKSIAIFPELFNTQYDLARTQSILGEFEEAEMSFVKAAKIDTLFPEAWLQAIDIAMSHHRYKDALQYFSLMQPKYIEESPNNILNFGYAYFLNKEYDLSIKVLKKGLSIFPNHADLNFALGESYKALSKKDSAIFYYEQSLKLNPTNEQLRQLILELK